MDCGASSLRGSAPATLYSAAGSSSSSSSAAAWSDRSSSVDDSDSDSDRSEGRFAFGSFKRVFLPENGRDQGAVTLEGLRPNRAIQCRIVAVDALTRRESNRARDGGVHRRRAAPRARGGDVDEYGPTRDEPIGGDVAASGWVLRERRPRLGAHRARPGDGAVRGGSSASAGVPSKREEEAEKAERRKGKGGGGKGESSNVVVLPARRRVDRRVRGRGAARPPSRPAVRPGRRRRVPRPMRQRRGIRRVFDARPLRRPAPPGAWTRWTSWRARPTR